MQNEATSKFLRYTLTPQILPRLQDLFFSGFSYIAFFMAQTYRIVRLLPDGHPYLQPANMGRFGIRHVIAAAASNLVLRRENIDQVIVFILMLVGIVILCAQLMLLLLTLFIAGASAGSLGPVPDTFGDYFLIPDATHDVAFVILDRVFGLPDMFVDIGRGTTCVVSGVPCFDLGQTTRELTPDTIIYTDYVRAGTHALVFPWPFHEALHAMFEVYNFGLLIIAVFIFLYFVTAVVAETAQSGTPFGRRFNQVWAPLRIVAAIGMLVPLPEAHGLNSAQWIMLYAAKWGSGFATNGWVLFNETAMEGGNTLLGNQETLIAEMNGPPANTMTEFFTIVAACKIAYELVYHERDNRLPVFIDAWLVNPQNAALAPERLLDVEEFLDAAEYFDTGDIHIRFGELRADQYQNYDGRVAPYCGELVLQVTDLDPVGSPGSLEVLAHYYDTIQFFWAVAGDFSAAALFAGGGACGVGYTDGTGTLNRQIAQNINCRYLPYFNDPNAPLPDSTVMNRLLGNWQEIFDIAAEVGVIAQRGSPEWTEELTALGWGGAAVWYNRVARLNGSLQGAVMSMPAIKKYPMVMEDIRQKRAAADTDLPGFERHQLFIGPDQAVELADEEDQPIAKVLFATQKLWSDHYSQMDTSGNIYQDAIAMIFGLSGLFNIHENADLQVHPLAQLATIGKGVMDAAIRNLGYSAAAGLGGGIINAFGTHMAGRVAMTASGFLSQIAMIGITVGFILYYVVPFLPFIYFFFAVGGWIKGIFEAMVGVPLWAMAHIRIDGNGLPGDAALNGYYLVLEIFLRPILIIFGFIASIIIYAAQVQILHEIWPIVTSNLTGFNAEAAKALDVNETDGMRYLRGAVDKFFFTVIYAIIVYMLGMASFKMIDLIPNHILRWMGTSVSTFGDQSGDPAENLVRNSMIGANMASQPVAQAAGQVGKVAQESGQAVRELAARTQ